jgi:hypothetical protein
VDTAGGRENLKEVEARSTGRAVERWDETLEGILLLVE